MDNRRVLILYNEPVLPPDHPDAAAEQDVFATVAVVHRALTDAGFAVHQLGASRDPQKLLAGLQTERPDVVFNLFEGLADRGDTEATAAGLLEWLGIPFTGSPSAALALARDKYRTLHLLRGAGVRVPASFLVERLPCPPCPLAWPVIVKPALHDASEGLDQGSVVTEQAGLANRVARLLRDYGPPVLVEEYVAGREFNVGLIEAPELRVLPLAEIVFLEQAPGYWPIVTFDAKWRPGSREYEATPRRPAEVDARLAAELAEMARRAFQLVACRDYGRVDFRARDGVPYVLEVNPNPDLSPGAGLAGGLAAAGLSHAEFAVHLVRAALARRA